MRKLVITQAKNRFNQGIRSGEVTWSELVKRLSRFDITPETQKEYFEHKQKEQLEIKDVGWFVGGKFKGNKRLGSGLEYRDVVCLDADHLSFLDIDELLNAYSGLEFFVHSSHKHTEDEPRLRLVFPLTRSVRPEEYEPLSRKLGERAGMDLMDDTTFQAARVMFWPSRSKDGAEFIRHNPGEWVDPDRVLSEYEDWQDFGEWPHSSREGIVRAPVSTKESPYAKPGAIGAFNRVFEVLHAIDHFGLPYEPTNDDCTRFSYLGGTSVDGARIYDDGHLHSDHESDPAHGNHNAWDLVRLHKFGKLDKDDSVPIGKRESQKQMQAFALSIPEVAKEMAADNGFEDLGEDTATSETGIQATVQDDTDEPEVSEFSFDSIRDAITNRSAPLDEVARRELVTKLAVANLSASDTSTLAGLIQGSHTDPKPGKANILNDIKHARTALTSHSQPGDGNTDIELDLLQAVLDKWFGGGQHIKCIGRQFWTYEGGVWGKREDNWIRSKVQDTFIDIRVARPNDSASLVAAMAEMSTSSATSHLWAMFCAHVTGLNESKDPLGLMKFDIDPVINCLNGELHFHEDGSFEFTDHHPELFLTSQIPVNWDPDADPSEWDHFCEVVFHDSLESDEMQRQLEEVGGYIIQPWREIPSFFLMKGDPKAGKSTFGTILNELMGSSISNNTLASYRGSNNHDTAGLVGKLLLLDEDFNKGDVLPDGHIKRVSEAKVITANPKGKEEFEFVCRAIPMVICNAWPATKDYSGALDRRLVAWDMATIPEPLQDDAARKRLLHEGLPGVLLRFVEGFARLYARGSWDRPGECEDAADSWRASTDNVRSFVKDCIIKKPGARLKRSETYGLFCQWYRDNIPGRNPMGKKEFLTRIQGILGPVRKAGEWGWPGVSFVGDDFER